MRKRLRSCSGPSRCLLLFTLCALEATPAACSGGVVPPGGVTFLDGIEGPSLASERRRWEAAWAGVMASRPWLAFRAEKGKREEEAEEDGWESGGCSVAGDAGADSYDAGEGERRAGRAERKPRDGRRVGVGACEAATTRDGVEYA